MFLPLALELVRGDPVTEKAYSGRVDPCVQKGIAYAGCHREDDVCRCQGSADETPAYGSGGGTHQPATVHVEHGTTTAGSRDPEEESGSDSRDRWSEGRVEVDDVPSMDLREQTAGIAQRPHQVA
jgi:hypothetical protein